MTVFDEAHVDIVVADYISADAAGKLVVVGGMIRFLGQVETGQSPPFAVAIVVAVPETYANQQFALTVEVHDVTVGQILTLGDPDPQPLRAQQLVTLAAIVLPPTVAKPDVQIDGNTRPGWSYRLHSLGPIPPIVVGGPAGPAIIPGVGPFGAF